MTTTAKHLLSQVKRTTGIGSLPHHNMDAALNFSFRMGIPFLPQIPIRNPWEFMIPQALEGLPGLQVDSRGRATLHRSTWQSQSHLLCRRLDESFRTQSFEGFEPSPSTSSCWQPFLWELQEREIRIAKVQIAGPITSQWVIRQSEEWEEKLELSTQIFQLVLARALAMVKRIRKSGIQPIIFIDEPGLYAFSPPNPHHALCLRELKWVVQSLQKEGAWVGLHCCSHTDWGSMIALGLDFLSIDSQLSRAQALESFINSGGRLALGVVPTSLSQSGPPAEEEYRFSNYVIANHKTEWVKALLKEAIFTPACGLALQSPSDSELILEKLVDIYESIAF